MTRASSGNLLDAAMYESLERTLSEALSDSTVRCILLCSAVSAFSVGHGRTEYVRVTEPDLAAAATSRDLMDRFHIPLLNRLRSAAVPLVAAVDGIAAGAGATLAFSCDVVIASRSAIFVEPFARTGPIRDLQSARQLRHSIGRARALGWTLLGTTLSAQDAARIGLIWGYTTRNSLLEEASSLAKRLAEMPPNVALAARRAIDNNPDI